MNADIPCVLAADRRCRSQAAQRDVHGAGHEEVRQPGVVARQAASLHNSNCSMITSCSDLQLPGISDMYSTYCH